MQNVRKLTNFFCLCVVVRNLFYSKVSVYQRNFLCFGQHTAKELLNRGMQFSVLLSLRVTQSTCTPECSHDLLLRHACSLVLELWCCRAAGTFNVAVSVARCAIFPPKFATFRFVWWVADFRNILAENLADFCRRSRPVLFHQKLWTST